MTSETVGAGRKQQGQVYRKTSMEACLNVHLSPILTIYRCFWWEVYTKTAAGYAPAVHL